MILEAAIILAANTVQPPTRFDHPHAGGVAVHWLDEGQMQRTCRTFTACTHGPTSGVCHVYINLRWRGTWLEAAYIRHEIAHCNGWAANHPD